jgi:DNA-directed RNA polymerase subunit RPC12/RpoP
MILQTKKREMTEYDVMCDRCGHRWQSIGEKPPVRCARCKSLGWNKPRGTNGRKKKPEK